MFQANKDRSRDTGMGLVLLCLVLHFAMKRSEFFWAAMALHVINMIWPQVYAPVSIVWFGVSERVGSFVSKVLLGLLFFGVVTPMGLARRLTAKDSLRLRAFKAGKESVMIERNHRFTASDLEKPY